MTDAMILVLFPMVVAFAGATDLLTMTIQNRVSAILVAGFCALAATTGMSAIQWGYHGLALAVVFVPFFTFFAFGWMGGGDVKLISAAALWIGFTPELIAFIALVAIYGTVLTVGLLMMRTTFVVPGPLLKQEWFLRLHDHRNGIPYGIAIAVAALQIYPETHWFKLIGQ